MSLITDISDRRQHGFDKLTPKADARKFRSAFAVVEGNAPPGWFGVQDYTSGITRGIPGHQKLLHYDEFKDENGKTNDIHYKGMKLREMVVQEEHAAWMDRYEGSLSEGLVNEYEKGKKDVGEGRSYTSHTKDEFISGRVHAEQEEQRPEPQRSPLVQGFDIPPAPRKPAGWSPAARAKAQATLAAKRAAKASQPTPT